MDRPRRYRDEVTIHVDFVYRDGHALTAVTPGPWQITAMGLPSAAKSCTIHSSVSLRRMRFSHPSSG